MPVALVGQIRQEKGIPKVVGKKSRADLAVRKFCGAKSFAVEKFWFSSSNSSASWSSVLCGILHDHEWTSCNWLVNGCHDDCRKQGGVEDYVAHLPSMWQSEAKGEASARRAPLMTPVTSKCTKKGRHEFE